jgi:hypothetical protein
MVCINFKINLIKIRSFDPLTDDRYTIWTVNGVTKYYEPGWKFTRVQFSTLNIEPRVRNWDVKSREKYTWGHFSIALHVVFPLYFCWPRRQNLELSLLWRCCMFYAIYLYLLTKISVSNLLFLQNDKIDPRPFRCCSFLHVI